MAISLEVEGTWEEVVALSPKLAGRRVYIRVLSEPDNAEDARLRVLREIESRSVIMNPQSDDRDLLREGRAGAMFGE